jgi:hypothetical protein
VTLTSRFPWEDLVSLYSISVFLHIVGALGLFAGIALEQVGLRGLRRASSVAQAREWVRVLGGLRRVDAPSGLTILATGVYMIATRWGEQAWAGLAILGMVLMAVLGVAVTGRRAGAIAKDLPVDDGPIPASLRSRLEDAVLPAAASIRAAIALGIVFNMSVKPSAPLAVVTLLVSLAAGAVVGMIRRQTDQSSNPSARIANGAFPVRSKP